MTIAVAVKDISVHYGQTHVLDRFSATITTGSLTAITGPNGAGKSTLLKLIAGSLKPTAGDIRVALPLAYLPQQSMLQRDFPLSVLQAAATGLWPKLGEINAVTAPARAHVMSALHEVGLQGLEHRQLSHLSGGQFQRLLFARLIVQNAPLLLLDEPFSGIDEATVTMLIQLIQAWQHEGRTILCVLHDRYLIESYFPERLRLDAPSSQASGRRA